MFKENKYYKLQHREYFVISKVIKKQVIKKQRKLEPHIWFKDFYISNDDVINPYWSSPQKEINKYFISEEINPKDCPEYFV
jgi:hypothetical protein